MKTFYIPTSSLNFTNILSSESISPKAFYSARSFGYGRWISTPENPYENSIILYDRLCGFSRPASDYEDHPMAIEIALDEAVYSTFEKAGEHVYMCDHSIYINPFSSSIIFFTEKDKRIALSMSDASIETKLVQLYNKKIIVTNPPTETFPALNAGEKQGLNVSEIEVDKKINRMKGLLYGYYIGAILSASKEDVIKLNNAREIHNILAAILASFDHKATNQQRERLKSLYSTLHFPVPFFSKLSLLVPEKSLFEAIVSLIRDEYGYIRGEFDIDRTLTQLLSVPASLNAKNPVVENINNIIKQTEYDMSKRARLLSADDRQIIVREGMLTHLDLKELPDSDKRLCVAWVNEVLSKEKYNGKVSTFKDVLSDDVTIKAKEICGDEWKGSYPERTLNALRRHVRGDEFPHKWNNDIYSSMSAVIIRGDDWQKLLQYMQGKEMTDYRIAFAFYGTLNGFANLPRDFTDILFSQDRKYIAEVYKKFYSQLYGRNVISSKPAVVETITPLNEVVDISNFENEGKEVSQAQSRTIKHSQSSVVQESKTKNETKSPTKGKKTKSKRGNKDSADRKPLTLELSNNLFEGTYPSTGSFLADYDFLANNSEFSSLMSGIDKKWLEDLRWFIEAHNPSHKDYKKYYQDKQNDNESIIRQFIGLKDGKYKIVESFLLSTYINSNMFNWGEKEKYEVLPDKRCSYVINENGEPMATYYHPNSGLFCSTPLSQADRPFFLNIRRPIIIDVENVDPVVIPHDLPAECDGIIFKNFGKNKITAFYVSDPNTQSMSF